MADRIEDNMQARYKMPELGASEAQIQAGQQAVQNVNAPEVAPLDSDWYRKQAEKYAGMRWGEGIIPTQTSPEIARFAGGEKELGKGGPLPFLSRAVDFGTAFASAFDKAVATKQANALASGKIKEGAQDVYATRKNASFLDKIASDTIDGFKNETIVKNRNLSMEALSTLSELEKDPTNAASIGIIYKFMKSFDPASVVREAEYQMGQNAASVLGSALNKMKVLIGQGLTEQTKGEFLSAAKLAFTGLDNLYQVTKNAYKQKAEMRASVNPDIKIPEGYFDTMLSTYDYNVPKTQTVAEKKAEKDKAIKPKSEDEMLKEAARKGDKDAQDILTSEGKSWD